MYKYFLLVSFLFIINSCATKNSDLNMEKSSNNINNNTQSNIILSYINEARAKGAKCAPPAPPLIWNSNLENAAISHSIDMAANNYLGHDGSGTYLDTGKKENGRGSTFIDRIKYFGYKIKPHLLVGENIAKTSHKVVGSSKLANNLKRVINNWLKEPAHCEILMNSRFKYVGGGAKTTSTHTYFTLDFAEEIK